MGQPFCAQNYALCFIIHLFIYLFISAARCRNVQGVQQYGTLIPMPKFLKMRPSYDTAIIVFKSSPSTKSDNFISK